MEVVIGCLYKNKKTGKIMKLISGEYDDESERIIKIELEPFPQESNWVGDKTQFDEEFCFPKI